MFKNMFHVKHCISGKKREAALSFSSDIQFTFVLKLEPSILQ